MPEVAEKLELRIMGPDEMNAVVQPDNIVWPKDSFCVCAFDEKGNLKGRVGLIALPHVEGTWVARDQYATGLVESLFEKLEETLKKTFGRTSIFAFVHEGATGYMRKLENHQWADLHLKVYQKGL